MKECITKTIFVLLGLAFITLVAVTNYHDGKQSMTGRINKCEMAVNQLQDEQGSNQEIINYLYEEDMRGEIQLDKQTIFFLGRIK